MVHPVNDTAFLSALFEALPAPILLYSPDSVIESNTRARAMLEADSSERLRGMPMSQLVHPGSREASDSRRRALFQFDQQPEPVAIELVSLRGNSFQATTVATSFTFDDMRYGVVVELGSSRRCTSLSTRTAPPEALGAGSVIGGALHVLPLPVLTVTTRVVTFVNQAACDMLGATDPAELVGVSAMDVLHPDARDAMHERVAPLISNEGRVLDLPLKALRLDGQCLRTSCLTTCTPYEDEPVFIFVATGYEPVAP
ncbi:MAG: PAS domain-containing protein [Coriobacteriia bacterium]|nr:PAS domain-containing protein [Coriobacteriia bacterium]